MSKILVLLMALLMLAGCSFTRSEHNPKALVPNGVIVQAQDSNYFDAKRLKVGDRVCGLKIREIELGEGIAPNYIGDIGFIGEAVVSGTYKHNINDEFLGHEISFIVDKEYDSKLPKLKHDERYTWFVFNNHDEAEKLFGPPGSEGKAIVVIDDYTIRYAHTEVWNTAKLIKIIKN